jgi:hypothetical protein
MGVTPLGPVRARNCSSGILLSENPASGIWNGVLFGGDGNVTDCRLAIE